MTTLPVCLPAAIAACMVAAGVFAVLVPVGAWIDWRERRRSDAQPETGLRKPMKAPQSHELRSRVPVEPEPAERRRAPQSRRPGRSKP